MPNWCMNQLTLKHESADELARAREALSRSELFHEYLPCPPELLEEHSFYADPVRREQLTRKNIAKYGARDGLDWCCANWGTKWDVDCGSVAVSGPGELTAKFFTAWSPPIAFYEHLIELGFEVRALYYEPGMAFAGLFDDGEDQQYSVSDLPDEIVEAFDISEDEDVDD